MVLPKELFEILACPVCKGDLKYKNKNLVCVKCKNEYEIKENIPILLPKEPSQNL